MKKPLRIDIEGTDGAGKTTGLKYFISQATDLKLKILETREVGNPHIPICVKLRELVLSPDSNLSGEGMELIFSAMKIENDKFYKAVGSQYDMIVSDRGLFSHLAYTDHNVSEHFTQKLYTEFMSEITDLPDVVIYFDVNTDTALKRRIKRGEAMDVIEQKGVPFQELVRASYQKYIGEYNQRIKIITVDANQDIQHVRNQLDIILVDLVK